MAVPVVGPRICQSRRNGEERGQPGTGRRDQQEADGATWCLT